MSFSGEDTDMKIQGGGERREAKLKQKERLHKKQKKKKEKKSICISLGLLEKQNIYILYSCLGIPQPSEVET